MRQGVSLVWLNPGRARMGCTLPRNRRESIELKHWVLGLLTNALLTLWPTDAWKRIPPEDIIRPLLWAAIRRTSVHRVCQDSPGTPSGRSIRGYIATLKWRGLMEAIPVLLGASVTGVLRSGGYSENGRRIFPKNGGRKFLTPPGTSPAPRPADRLDDPAPTPHPRQLPRAVTGGERVDGRPQTSSRDLSSSSRSSVRSSR
jgi:hypothetical protein